MDTLSLAIALVILYIILTIQTVVPWWVDVLVGLLAVLIFNVRRRKK